MKLRFNKACDLSSISVLPPPNRRPNPPTNGLESSSAFGRGQMIPKMQAQSQQQQHSQQTVSQAVSSRGLVSQLSQNSQDEILTNERYGSQERDISLRRTPSLPPISCTREESQMMVCRPNSSMIRKWSSQENKCHVSEELEHRIGVIETSLSRFGFILDSVQSDVMQVCRGTKEMSLETEAVRLKLIAFDDSLQSMSKGQDEIKAQLDKDLKLLFDQFKQTMNLEHFAEIMRCVSELSDKLDAQFSRLKNEILRDFQREIQVMYSCTKTPEKKQETSSMQIPEVAHRVSPRNVLKPKKCVIKPYTHCIAGSKSEQQISQLPKIETGGWITVKQKDTCKIFRNQVEQRVLIDSDEDIDAGFSCLFKEKEREEVAIEETARILRKARRRKRKYCNTIIIN